MTYFSNKIILIIGSPKPNRIRKKIRLREKIIIFEVLNYKLSILVIDELNEFLQFFSDLQIVDRQVSLIIN